MKVLITAGPTREPIDAVRFISNRSSGRMGLALAGSAIAAGHQVTLILGPIFLPAPDKARRVDVQTTAQMQEAVFREFPGHDLLIMAAAPADYRPTRVCEGKIGRQGNLTLELEATADIVAAVARTRRSDQRIVAFSLEVAGNLDRAREKMAVKRVDMMVYNPLSTMDKVDVAAVLLWPDGKSETVDSRSKADFADLLVQRAVALFAGARKQAPEPGSF